MLYDIKSFVLALLIVGLSPALAFAQNPFAPSLTLNENPEICSAFQGAWVDVYDSSKKIDDSAVDLKAAFPAANHISPTVNDANAGVYQRSHVSLDYDGDGDEEIIYFESKEPKHLYWATGFYLYESLEDFESEPAERPQFGRFNNWAVGADAFKNPKDSKAKLLAMYKDLQVAQIFQIDGKLYSQSEVKGARRRPYRTFGTGHNPRNVTLDWLRPDHSPTPICKIDFTRAAVPLQSNRLNLDAAIQPDLAIMKPLGEMTSGRQRQACYGSLGHSAVPIGVHLTAMLKRPQTMGKPHYPEKIVLQTPSGDTAREFRFIAWGLSDPTSFEVLRDLKSHYPKFITDFTVYYQTYFEMDEETARATAELAYRYLLDKAVYGRSTNLEFHRDVYSSINIGPSLSLKEIANIFIDKHLEGDLRNSGLGLRLGLKSGVAADRLKPVVDAVMKQMESRANKVSDAKRNVKVPSEKQTIINTYFLDSLTHPEMRRYFIELGADVDFPTNYFDKTALMYAAQNDDLGSVVALLKSGADPNRKTQMDERRAPNCAPPLSRDARTPLMYAAENADATLILTLMEAGVDVAARDTEENNILWYLERNKILSDEQKATLKSRFFLK